MFKLRFLFLVFGFTFCKAIIQENFTVISNESRDFKQLYLGDDSDYYVSINKATAEEAKNICQSIGENFHLVAFENESEQRQLLPYLRSLGMEKLWTSGRKYNSTSQKYQWTSSLPSFSMNFTNFPASSMLAKLTQFYSTRDIQERKRRGQKRCKNWDLASKCTPGRCNVTLPECTTDTPQCTITSQSECSSVRPECGSNCNNCTIIPPVCHVQQEPCTVVTEDCVITKPPCKVGYTEKCNTTRGPCEEFHPPCQVTTPGPCTTTRRPCSTSHQDCTTTIPPCSGGKCAPPTTFCKPLFKCEEPIICQPGAIICPSPTYICPPEITVCPSPVVECDLPKVDCPPPIATCPEPEVVCTPAQVTCDAPEISCPGVIVTCPSPSYHCTYPSASCPAPIIDCEEPVPCKPNPTITRPPCEFEEEEVVIDSNEDCDDCRESGCIVLRKETDFKWKLEECSDKFHFICEGK